jgi:hypothetical protein
MGRLIKRRRFNTWLALAALAFQIVVSFGHVHLDDLRIVAPRSARIDGRATALAAQHAPAQAPNEDDDGYCAICASIFLASTSFVPAPPVLPLPDRLRRIVHAAPSHFGFVAEPRRTAFQSRAPPAA